MLQALFQKGEEKNERNLFPLGRRSDVSNLFFSFFFFPSMKLPRARLQVGTCKKSKRKENVYVVNLEKTSSAHQRICVSQLFAFKRSLTPLPQDSDVCACVCVSVLCVLVLFLCVLQSVSTCPVSRLLSLHCLSPSPAQAN